MVSTAAHARRRIATWADHVLAVDAFQRVLALCAPRGIDVLPVKGILTGRILYSDVTERPIADIDLRIRPCDLPRLRQVVTEAGWRVARWAPAYFNLVFYVGELMVDVEATIGPPGLCGLKVADMIARSTGCTRPFGFPHRQPELHDHALVLVVNVFKDKLDFASAWALRDLERVARMPGFEPRILAERASSTASVTLTWIVADFMARIRGDVAWAAVREALAPPRSTYVRLFAALRERAPGLPLRLLARTASDVPRRWAPALARMVWWRTGIYLSEGR